MTRQLILVGGIHSDTDGASRLVKAIERFEPSDLSIEALPTSIQIPLDTIDHVVRSIRGNQFLSNRFLTIDEERLAELSNLLKSYGYEVKVAELYKRMWTPRVYKVDTYVPKAARDESFDSAYAEAADRKPDLVRAYEDLALEIFTHLVDGKDLPKSLSSVAAGYLALTFFLKEEREAIDNYRYSGPFKIIDPNVQRETETRDGKIEQRIRDLWKRAGRDRLRGNFMHFGGIEHIFGEYPNLFERLSDLSPVRYRLNEFK